LNYQPVSEEIIRQTLRTNQSEILQSEGSGVVRDIPVNIIVNELINFPEVDYDREAELLFKLATQAVAKLGYDREKEDVRNIIIYHKHDIAKFIYAQLQQHFYLEKGEFAQPTVHSFTKIEPHNFSKYTADSIHHYTETIVPTNMIPSKIFSGFKKACHNLYKFDSKSEKDFSAILENDQNVIRWLRPAMSQFLIYWKHNSKRYVPDFVVETADSIFMIEIKAEKDIDDEEVREKAEAGKIYCDTATRFNLQNNGKKWIYVLIPHTVISPSMGFDGLCKKSGY
jgi:type III restriction enzyme